MVVFMTKTKKIIRCAIIIFIVCVLIAADVLACLFSDAIGTYLGGYDIDVSNIDFTKSKELCEEIEAEGLVLLKNDDTVSGKKSLPLADSVNKVNIFGWSSISPAYSGGGSGDSGSTDKAVSFYQALENEGIEYNKSLYEMYVGYKGKRDDDNYWGKQYPYLNLIEPNANYIEEKVDLESVKQFSDTAIVFLSRLGGEHQDLPKRQVKWGGQVTDESRTYLDITKEEEELFKLVSRLGFDNVIVIVNSINSLNLSFLKNSSINSAINVGALGQYGATAVVKAIKGLINPSGKTTDTYVYDFSTNPTYVNSPDGHIINTASSGVKSYSNEKDMYYIDYQENIYLGYKWYETADKDGFWDTDFAKNKWKISNGYADVVQYPFGYGLSYTDFKWDIVSVSPSRGSSIDADTEISITVRVENTGSVKGADVVQLYYEAPYLSGGIEKASKNLCAFQKTVQLNPNGSDGSSTEIILSCKASDMASYDYDDANKNGHIGYELEKGEYTLYLSTDSHNLAKIDGTNNDSKISFKVKNDIKISEIDESEVYNKFTDDSALDNAVSCDGSNTDQNIKYLTRKNFEKSFPKGTTTQRKIDFKLSNDWNTYNDTDEKSKQGVSGNLKLFDEKGNANYDLINKLGSNYDDPKWEDLLNQMTKDDLVNLYLLGGYQTCEIESIGKPKLLDLDGPQGLNGSVMTNKSTDFVFYPSETVLAQSWSHELAYKYGMTVGYEAKAGVSGWYAPACNLHRSPFGGRNYEYYSEDAYLSGMMAANTITGAKNSGLYCYLKHFALNETASCGNNSSIGLFTWVTEQALREVYLKSFEIAIKDGGANAVMVAYNKIGSVWCGGSYALLNGILRDEWNFKGSVVTDAWVPSNGEYDFDLGLRSGVNIILNSSNTSIANRKLKDKTSTTALHCLRESAHSTLYTLCNTLYQQYEYTKAVDSGKKADMVVTSVNIKGNNGHSLDTWAYILIAVNVVVISGLLIWLYFIFIKKNKNTLKGENHEKVV